MPDGDSLNWKVRGKRSRIVLSLVRSGADPCLVGQEAARMLVSQANEKNWKPVIRRIAGLMPEGIRALRSTEGFGSHSEKIDQICEGIQAAIDGCSDGSAGWMLSASRRAICALDDAPSAPDSGQVRQELMSSLAAGLLDQRVLQPVRQDLAREAGRDRSEQFAFEHEVIDSTRSEGARLVGTFFNAPPDAAVRTPVRTVPVKITDLDRLSEPLTVLGGLL